MVDSNVFTVKYTDMKHHGFQHNHIILTISLYYLEIKPRDLCNTTTVRDNI